MAWETQNNKLESSNITDINNNWLRVDDLLNEYNKDSKLTKEERGDIKRLYEAEKDLISKNTSQDVINLKQKIEWILDLSKNPELSNLDWFDEFTTFLSISERSWDFFNIMKTFNLLSKENKTKIIDNFDTNTLWSFPSNETELLLFINENSWTKNIIFGNKEFKTESDKVKIESETKDVNSESLTLLKENKLKPIYDELLKDFDKNLSEKEKDLIIMKILDSKEWRDKIYELIKVELDKVNKNGTPEEKKEFYRQVLRFSAALQTQVGSGDAKLNSFIADIQEYDIATNNILYKPGNRELVGINITSQWYTHLDGKWNTYEKQEWGIKDQIVVSRDWDVKRKLVSKSWYNEEIPATLMVDKKTESEEKLRLVESNITENQQKQEKVKTFLTELNQEKEGKINELKELKWTDSEKEQKLTEEIKQIDEKIEKLKNIQVGLENECSKLIIQKDSLNNDISNPTLIDENIKNKEKIARNKLDILDTSKITEYLPKEVVDNILDYITKENKTFQIDWVYFPDFTSQDKSIQVKFLKWLFAKILNKDISEIYNWDNLKLIAPPKDNQDAIQDILRTDPKIILDGEFKKLWLIKRLNPVAKTETKY